MTSKKYDPTLRKTRALLSKDFPRLLLVTGKNYNDFWTIKLEKINRASGIDKLNYYNNVLYCLTKALVNLEDSTMKPYKKIIIAKYIHRKKNKDIEKLIGYKHNYTCILINRALLNLTELLKTEQIKNKVYPIVIN